MISSPDLSPRDKIVLLALAGGALRESYPQLGERVGMTPRSIYKAIKSLEHSGLITVAQDRRSTNAYTINWRHPAFLSR